jgi:hypothetical protein
MTLSRTFIPKQKPAKFNFGTTSEIEQLGSPVREAVVLLLDQIGG